MLEIALTQEQILNAAQYAAETGMVHNLNEFLSSSTADAEVKHPTAYFSL